MREAAISRSDCELHDVTDEEAAIQGDAIEARHAAIGEAREQIELAGCGRCVACGAAIAEARLDALPTTTVCRECAAREGVKEQDLVPESTWWRLAGRSVR